MSLKIRLARGGAKKRPYYRIVVADSRRARDGRFIERLGSYNPMLAKDNPSRVQFDEERIKYWLGVGAKPSDRIARFLHDAGLGEKPAIPEQTKKHLPKAKAQERMAEQEEKRKAAAEAEEEAKREAAEAAAAAAATPTEEEVAAEADAPAEEAAAEEASAEEAPAEEAAAEDETKKEA